MFMDKKIPVIAVIGPTASGKTGLAVAIAKKFGGEVVSADSMQIYSELTVGTAKPTEKEMDGIPHHLVGHKSIDEEYDAKIDALYKSLAPSETEQDTLTKITLSEDATVYGFVDIPLFVEPETPE